MHGYHKIDLFDKNIQIKKSSLLKKEALFIFYSTKMNPRKGIKSFFSNRFKADI